jgi:bacterioferritin-associated ferredoxin
MKLRRSKGEQRIHHQDTKTPRTRNQELGTRNDEQRRSPGARVGTTTVVCRCEEVTEQDIRTTVRKGYHSLEELKRILRCGMGHCQGRSCMTIIARILAQEAGVAVAEMRFPCSRPPLKPVPLELLGSYREASAVVARASCPCTGGLRHGQDARATDIKSGEVESEENG